MANDHILPVRPSRLRRFKSWIFGRRHRNNENTDLTPFTPLSAGGDLSDTAPWSAPPEPAARRPRLPALPGERTRRPSYTPRYAARDALLSIPSTPEHLPRRSASAKTLQESWGGDDHHPTTAGPSYTGKGKSPLVYDHSGPWGPTLEGTPSQLHIERHLQASAQARAFSSVPGGDVPALPAMPDLAYMSGALPAPPAAGRSKYLWRASHMAQQGDDQEDMERAWEMAGFDIDDDELAPPLPPLPQIEPRMVGAGGGRQIRGVRSMGTIHPPESPLGWESGVRRNFSRPDSPSVLDGRPGTSRGKCYQPRTSSISRPLSPIPPHVTRAESPTLSDFGPAPSPPPTHALPTVPLSPLPAPQASVAGRESASSSSAAPESAEAEAPAKSDRSTSAAETNQNPCSTFAASGSAPRGDSIATESSASSGPQPPPVHPAPLSYASLSTATDSEPPEPWTPEPPSPPAVPARRIPIRPARSDERLLPPTPPEEEEGRQKAAGTGAPEAVRRDDRVGGWI